MSISRLAVRIAAVNALLDATLAEGRVYDSTTTPLDAAIKEQPRPFIAVTTDSHERDITGRDLHHGEDSLDLVIEFGIAERVRVTVEGDEGEREIVTIPNTDAGIEFSLDILEKQICEALTWQKTAWSRVFCGLAFRFTKLTSRRAAMAEDGLRAAMRQVVITCDVIADPIRVAPISSAWADFLAQVEATAGLNALAPVLRLQLEGDEIAGWEAMGRALGISQAAADALGGGGPYEIDEGSGHADFG